MLINEVFDVRDLELDRIIDLPQFFPLRPNIRILVVVDTEIGLSLSPGSFGVGRVIKLLRDTTVGCTSFTVDIAIRDTNTFSDSPNATGTQARYRGFRFNSTAAGGQPVINGYHELFLFGFKPSNSGSSNDAEITQPSALAATDDELSVLETFMRERKGGVFGTGDHHFLGASMCHRIPRLGTMRRWTNNDGVPTIGGTTRLDTNQPANAAQQAGALISNSVERDAIPQKIEWVADRRVGWGFNRRIHPHSLLCHPTHGPINVMPDHPHEGQVTTHSEIDFSASYDFGDGRHDEYPSVGNKQTRPQIIAWGNTVPDPPFNHAKGAQPAVRFPMISAYDGHTANVGRVVTDSTWHHWMNLNLQGMEAAPNKTNWEKVSRYFINIATWMAPPGVFRSRCWWELVVVNFNEVGFQEFSPKASTLELGTAFRGHLLKHYGPCWVRQWVHDILWDLNPKIFRFFEDRQDIDKPDTCLSCPPWDVIEAEVLGGLIKGVRTPVQRFERAFDAIALNDRRRRFDLSTEELVEAGMKGAAASVKSLARDIVRDAERLAKAFDA